MRNETQVILSALTAEWCRLRCAQMGRWRSRISSWGVIEFTSEKVRFQVKVKGIERLFIPAPIEIIKFESTGVIQQSGPAVRFAAPRAYNLRLIAIIEAAAATGTCFHRTLLSFELRRMSGNQFALEHRMQCRPWRANYASSAPEMTSAPLPPTALNLSGIGIYR